ncbi:MAG TPA: type II toxin-antitoxin system ParD family antitoxin [Allosphingosinicella sp.]|jgi:antitoxin ParD1/3/4
MGTAQKLSIALTEELVRDIESAVSSGDYSTASEVVRDALRAWKRERAGRDAAIQRLRQLWDEGLASGEPVEGGFDAEETNRHGHERLAAERRKAG